MFDEQGVPFVSSKALEVMYVQITLTEVIDVLTGTIDFKAKLWPLLVPVVFVSIFAQGRLSNPAEVEVDSFSLVFFDSNKE
jgi:hypothetical protein